MISETPDANQVVPIQADIESLDEAAKTTKVLVEDDYDWNLHQRQGGFFAFAFVPLWFCGLLAGVNHLLTYLKTKAWFRNAAALAFGFVDTKGPETTATSLVIDIHACLGISVVFTLVFQVLTGLRLHRSKRQGLQPSILLHKLGGRVVALVWSVTAWLGTTFTIVSKRWQQEDVGSRLFTTVIFWSVGVGTLINMYLGIAAIRTSGNEQEISRNRVRHKGLMFFSIFWIIGSAFDECLMSAVQTVVRECHIDSFGGFLCGSIGQTLQLSALFISAYCFEKSIIDYKFFKVNFGLLGFRTLMLWSSIVFMQVTGEKSGNFDQTTNSSCFDASK